MNRLPWLVLGSFVTGGDADVSMLAFSRKLNTCDEADNAILQGTQRVVYAYNDAAPANNDPDLVGYHGPNRGAKSLSLMANDTDVLPPLEPDAFSWDIRMPPTRIPEGDTVYYCTAYRLPSFQQPVHIVRFSPIIPTENLDVLHHILAYDCPGNLTDEELNYSGSCHSPNMPMNLAQCNFGSPMGTWAVGGSTFDYPRHVGMPLGRPDSARYVLMEVHYDNPQGRAIVDSSGIRYWTTPTLRANEGGILVSGHFTSSLFSIPAGIQRHEEFSWCPGECTRAILPDGGVTVISAMLHAHLLGREIRVGHSRNGVELPDIINDRSYDFNFQDMHRLLTPVKVLPGDQLTTTCFFDSTSRANSTNYGISTQDEMCLSYLVYYPRARVLPTCFSGDFSRTIYPEWGMAVECARQMITAPPQPIVVPLPEEPCTYTPPNRSRTQPVWNATYDIRDYIRHETLDRDNKIRLHWRTEGEYIHFLVEAETKGWFAIGISPNGGMDGSDVLLGWLDANTRQVFLHDRFAAGKFRPARDALQDLFDIRGAVIFGAQHYEPPVSLVLGAVGFSAVFVAFVARRRHIANKQEKTLKEQTITLISSA